MTVDNALWQDCGPKRSEAIVYIPEDISIEQGTSSEHSDNRSDGKSSSSTSTSSESVSWKSSWWRGLYSTLGQNIAADMVAVALWSLALLKLHCAPSTTCYVILWSTTAWVFARWRVLQQFFWPVLCLQSSHCFNNGQPAPLSWTVSAPNSGTLAMPRLYPRNPGTVWQHSAPTFCTALRGRYHNANGSPRQPAYGSNCRPHVSRELNEAQTALVPVGHQSMLGAVPDTPSLKATPAQPPPLTAPG